MFQPPPRPAESVRQVRHEGHGQDKVDELAQRLPEGRGAGDRDAGPQEDHKGRGRRNGEQEVNKGRKREEEQN